MVGWLGDLHPGGRDHALASRNTRGTPPCPHDHPSALRRVGRWQYPSAARPGAPHGPVSTERAAMGCARSLAQADPDPLHSRVPLPPGVDTGRPVNSVCGGPARPGDATRHSAGSRPGVGPACPWRSRVGRADLRAGDGRLRHRHARGATPLRGSGGCGGCGSRPPAPVRLRRHHGGRRCGGAPSGERPAERAKPSRPISRTSRSASELQEVRGDG